MDKINSDNFVEMNAYTLEHRILVTGNTKANWEKIFVGFCRLQCIVGHTKKKEGDIVEDVQLVHALQTRQAGAVEQFQTAYTPLLRYIIAPILPDARDREECLSDVLLRVWDSIGTFDPGKAALTTWLTHLTRNAALNRRRGNERRREGGTLDETMPDSADGPEQSLLKAEAARTLWAAVERLGRRDRELFLRKYYYYQPIAQIAAESGLTVRAVEGKLYRIRKHLQSELGDVIHG